jgi:hypothetical protein
MEIILREEQGSESRGEGSGVRDQGSVLIYVLRLFPFTDRIPQPVELMIYARRAF